MISTSACVNSVASSNHTSVSLPRWNVMDFSFWDSGYFSEVLEGNVLTSYSVDFDGNGNPIKIYDAEHECEIEW